MDGWLTEVLGEQGATITLYILGAAIVLLLIWVAWFWIKRIAAGAFIEGGRNRRHRLAIVDAASIDNQRRLILVRRDDVEHLVLIGGQNDVVIESGIAKTAAEQPQRDPSRDRRSRDVAPPARPAPEREPAPQPAAPVAREAIKRPSMNPVPPASPAPPVRTAFAPERPTTPTVSAPTPEPPQRDEAPVRAPVLRPQEPRQEPKFAPVNASRIEPVRATVKPTETQPDSETRREPRPDRTPEPSRPAVASMATPFVVASSRPGETNAHETERQDEATDREEPHASDVATRATEFSMFGPVVADAPARVAANDVIASATIEPVAEPSPAPVAEEPAREEPVIAETPDTETPAAEDESVTAVEPQVESGSEPEKQIESAGSTEVETAKAETDENTVGTEKPAGTRSATESLEDEMHRLLAQLTSGSR